MNNIIIDTKKFEIKEKEKNYLIYQYCYKKGIELPCFCYNENLEIAGNCRICLIEIEKMPKLLLACATKIERNMNIKTKNKRVQRVRKSIIEFLLINHPLDCPICDQGGECDLQNIARNYGLDRGRFYEFVKRSVIDKESGFFIKTIMTRCIHCTRCIRFFKEIVGLSGFSLLGRGELTEIVVNKFNLLSILSGNVIDLCPVGALTSKIYKFKGRSWELNKYENIDILDTMCSSICLDLRNNIILRILPVSDSFLNLDWITNITRYFFDALSINRLLKPFLILNKVYLELSWITITNIIINKLLFYIVKKKGFICLLEDFIDLESLFYLKNFNLQLGYLNINLKKNLYNNIDYNFFFFFNSKINNLKNYLFYFFIALNLRLKMPLLNAILRKKLKKKKIIIYSLGLITTDISLNVLNLGNSLFSFFNILKNKNKFIFTCYYNSYFLNSFFNIKNYKNIAYIVGENFFFIKNAYKLLINFYYFFNISLNNLYILFNNVIDLNYQELSLKANKNLLLKNQFIYSFKSFLKKKKSFSILQNSFFSKDLIKFNLILPTVTFFEYSGLFLNFEGRLRKKIKIYNHKSTALKSNIELLKYFNIILKNNFFFFNYKFFKFFINLINYNYDFFLNFYKNLILKKININIKIFFFYNLKLENNYIFDYLINIYRFKNLYKISYTLNKVSNSLNSYLNIYNEKLI